jgi:GT2 family glycosyltransferase
MAQATKPLISVIIVNHNGAEILPRCLDAVMAQTIREYEVIIVDNASSDGSADMIADRWPAVKIIRSETNNGFAVGNNIGAQQASGKWLALLNNDAFPQPDWMEKLLEASHNYPDFAFFASQLIQANQHNLIDATGDIYHASGLSWHRDRNQPIDMVHREAGEIFSACAAAALYDRAAFLAIGGFDETYFSHHEDVDLGFRLRLRGLRGMYVPEAVVHHIGSATFGIESDRTVYQMHRNFIWTYVKNTPGHLIWLFLPAHLLANLVFLLHYTLRGQWSAIIRAKIDAVRGLPEMFRKRKNIQRSRQIEPGDILPLIERGWFAPYLLGRRGSQLRKLSTNR